MARPRAAPRPRRKRSDASPTRAPVPGLAAPGPLPVRAWPRGHGLCVWLTGLAGAGTTALARALEAELVAHDVGAYHLDGDALRRRLSPEIAEDVRSLAAIAWTLHDAGLVAIVASTAPRRADRERARALFPAGRFSEVHVDMAGSMPPYEAPLAPELTLATGELSAADATSRLLATTLSALRALGEPAASEPADGRAGADDVAVPASATDGWRRMLAPEDWPALVSWLVARFAHATPDAAGSTAASDEADVAGLWAWLAAAPDAERRAWALRLVPHVASGEAERWAAAETEPTGPLEARLAWYAAAVRHRTREVVARGLALAADAREAAPTIAFEAAVATARAYLSLGDLVASDAALAVAVPTDPAAWARKCATAARLAHMRGDYATTTGLAQTLRAQWATMSEALQREVALESHIMFGALAEPEPSGPSRPLSRPERVLHALRLVFAARFDAALALLDAADDLAEADPTVRVLAHFASAIAASRHTFEDAVGEAEDALTIAAASGHETLCDWAWVLRLALDWMTAGSASSAGDARLAGRLAASDPRVLVGPQGAYVHALVAGLRVAAHPSGALDDTPLVAAVARLDAPVPARAGVAVYGHDLAVTRLLGGAIVAFLAGRFDEAERLARSAVEATAHPESRLFEIVCRMTLATILVAACAPTRADALALQALASRCAYRGAEGVAEIALQADARHPELVVLERWAADGDAAPIAARWARGVLCAQAPASRVEALVRDALDARWEGIRIDTLVGDDTTTTWRPGWGFDAVAGVVWREDGTVLDLGRRPLQRALMETLCRHGAAASKETLMREAWGLPSYHPLRDDKRLQMAIGRLRRMLDDGCAPDRGARLVTTPDGYAIGADRPFRWCRRGS